jgi:hypothetical protein
VKHLPHHSIRHQPMTPGDFSPQDDTTVKCWGLNIDGQLGLGDNFNRGDDANGPCPPSSIIASFVPASLDPTLAPALGVQRIESGVNLPSVDLGG